MTIMDCQGFEDRLDEFEAGTLSAAEAAAAEKHMRACVRCRKLHSMARGDSSLLPPDLEQDLALSILDRTSGRACSDAGLCLCQWVDGTLSEADQEIVSLHVAHCEDCRALASSLRELREVLPDMVEVDPGPAFLAEVLRATGGRHLGTSSAELARKVREFCNRLLRRPRFAWEAAYVGALLVLLALGNPGNIPRLLPHATAVPQLLIRNGNHLLQETTTILGEKREAAKRSLSDIQFQGKNLLETAGELRNRTATSLRTKVSSFLEEMKASLFESPRTEESRREQR